MLELSTFSYILNNFPYNINSPITTITSIIKNNIDQNSEYKITYRKNSSLTEIQLPNFDSSFLPLLTDFTINSLTFTLTYVGLTISRNALNDYITTTKLFGSPVFNTEKNLITVVTYNKEEDEVSSFIVNNVDLATSTFCSFCNMKNKLFISGGMSIDDNNERELSNEFISIDLSTHEIERLPSLVSKHAWHNMLYVPPCFIFIISGINCKDVEVYNSETNAVYIDSCLSETRCECASCLVNNTYLYVFNGYLENFGFLNSIEKCNLRKKNREWEVVNYDNTGCMFYPTLFPLLNNISENEIILLGVEEINSEAASPLINSYAFLYNNQSKEIIKKISTKINNSLFPEKFAFPLNNNNDQVLISLNIAKVTTIYKFNSKGKIINKIQFEVN